MEVEPVVSEEQGVVYLFCKYWKKINSIKKLGIGSLQRIGTRFPDITYYDVSGSFGGIEIEDNLSKFLSHLKGKGMKYLKKFYNYENTSFLDWPDAPLIVVYWKEDTSIKELKIKFNRIINGKDINFVNLQEFFTPIITKNNETLLAGYIFNNNKNKSQKNRIYSLSDIKDDFNKLRSDNTVQDFSNKKNLTYRFSGFDLKGADNVSIEHWSMLNFYTTSSRLWSKDSKPKIIFFKPKDMDYVSAYFRPLYLFKFKDKNKKKIGKFYKKYYLFFPYEDSKCVIYMGFKSINKEIGKKIFKKVKEEQGEWNPTGYTIHLEEQKNLIQYIDKLLMLNSKIRHT